MTSITRRPLLAAAALGLAARAAPALAAADSLTTETRELSGFTAISLRGAIDLVVRQGTREAVQVSAEARLLPQLVTVVEGSGDQRTLRIQWKSDEWLRTRSRAVVTVDVVRLTAVAAGGSGDIRIGALNTPTLALSIGGSSDAKLEQLTTEQLRIAIGGSGDVQAAGRASRLDISIAGSGDVQTHALAADDVSVAIAGSGDANVQANKSLAVSIAGSGDVVYSGSASVTKASVAGSGSIRQRK